MLPGGGRHREEEPARGTIGRPLPSLATAVVDLEIGQRVAPGAIGMLLVRGPSVFGGYLAWNGPQPFVAFEGHTWYRTGDLVRHDPQGNLVFAGRLKRFVKMGGEMVSLPAVEETLLARFGRPEDQEPPLAVEALETEGRADLVLFTVRPIAREDANAAIREAGLGPIHNIRLVRSLEKIPLLGTGKTDYRALKAMLEPAVSTEPRDVAELDLLQGVPQRRLLHSRHPAGLSPGGPGTDGPGPPPGPSSCPGECILHERLVA